MVLAKDSVDSPDAQPGGGYYRENKKCLPGGWGNGPDKKMNSLAFLISVRAPPPDFQDFPAYPENQVLRANPSAGWDKRIPQDEFFFIVI